MQPATTRPHGANRRRRLSWKAAAVAALSGALVFAGASGASAVEPPVVVSTHSMATNGAQLLIKAPGSTTVYSASPGGTSVGVLNTVTNITSTIPITGATHREFDLPTSGRLYVTSANGIDVIDTTSNTAVGFFAAPTGVTYQSLAVDPTSGNLYVAASTGITILSPTDGSVVGSLSGSLNTGQLAISGSTGTLYAVNGSTGNVTAFDLSTGTAAAVSTVGNVRGSSNPNGVAIDVANNRVITVSQTGANADSISVFDGTTLALINTFPTGGTNVWGIGYMPQSGLAVVNFAGPVNPRLIDADSGELTPITVVAGITRGLFVDQANEYTYVSGSTNTTLTVLAVPAAITTTSLPDSQPGASYAQSIDVQGSRPMTFAVTAGALPDGLTLDPATGQITGATTTPGVFTFTVTATNAAGAASQEYTIQVGDAPVITTPSLPGGVTGAPYSTTVEATGAGPITFAVTAGALPDGLTLDPATGVVSGTPTTAGTFTFTVTAGNVLGTDTQEYTVEILEGPIITTPSLPAGTVATGYTATVEATGTGPITFAVTAGALPDGLTLDPATGIISGTPTAAGAFTFTVTATDTVGEDAQAYTITIEAAIIPTNPPGPNTPAGPTDPGGLAITGAALPWLSVAGGLLLAAAGAGILMLRRRRA